MAKGHKEHHHGKHHKRHKKGGGRIGLVAEGNPDVLKEADDDKDGDETGHERKKGGRVKKEKHEMEGKHAKHRMDRPGRKRGGAVGANTSPLSTAHKAGHGTDGSSNPKDTYGGTPA